MIIINNDNTYGNTGAQLSKPPGGRETITILGEFITIIYRQISFSKGIIFQRWRMTQDDRCPFSRLRSDSTFSFLSFLSDFQNFNFSGCYAGCDVITHVMVAWSVRWLIMWHCDIITRHFAMSGVKVHLRHTGLVYYWHTHTHTQTRTRTRTRTHTNTQIHTQPRAHARTLAQAGRHARTGGHIQTLGTTSKSIANDIFFHFGLILFNMIQNSNSTIKYKFTS